MTLVAFRLCVRRHAATAFTGEGARRAGGRWNPPGVPVVYASGSLALAVLEYLAHFDSALDMPDLAWFRLEFDDAWVSWPDRLPEDWRTVPAPGTTQAIGEYWIKQGQSAILRVPSVLIPTEYNYLVNPAHGDFSKIARSGPETFQLDPRLVE